MSDTSQGPGWWIASDGKWYPPEQAAPTQPTPATSATPPSGPPPPGPPMGAPIPTAPSVTPQPPPPAKSSSGKGCIIALAVVGGLVFIGIIASIAAITFFGGKAADKISEAATDKPCKIITGSDAGSVLGGKYDSVQLTGFNAVGNVILDSRVLPDADGCWIRPADSGEGIQGRVAKAGGGHTKYEAELTTAKGTTEDRGGGLSVETLGYYAKDVDGLGDEAFCTDLSIAGESGVVFRKGDNVYYVSVSIDPNGTGTADSNCDLSVKLAKKAD